MFDLLYDQIRAVKFFVYFLLFNHFMAIFYGIY